MQRVLKTVVPVVVMDNVIMEKIVLAVLPTVERVPPFVVMELVMVLKHVEPVL